MQSDDVIWYVQGLSIQVESSLAEDADRALSRRDIINRQHCSYKIKCVQRSRA